jgi:hypothetical protein
MPAKIEPPKVSKDAAFKENSYYEHLIELRRTQPEVFAVLSPVEKLTLGYYEVAKRRQALISDEATLPPAA